MSADKKDYENICAQYGITDFRWMLKKLNEMKTEKEQEQGRVLYVSTLSKCAHKSTNTASK